MRGERERIHFSAGVGHRVGMSGAIHHAGGSQARACESGGGGCS